MSRSRKPRDTNAASFRKKFWFLYHDFGEEAQGYLPSLSGVRRNNYPEETAWLAGQLKNPEFLRTFTEEYAAFLSAYDRTMTCCGFGIIKPGTSWMACMIYPFPAGLLLRE